MFATHHSNAREHGERDGGEERLVVEEDGVEHAVAELREQVQREDRAQVRRERVARSPIGLGRAVDVDNIDVVLGAATTRQLARDQVRAQHGLRQHAARQNHNDARTSADADSQQQAAHSR